MVHGAQRGLRHRKLVVAGVALGPLLPILLAGLLLAGALGVFVVAVTTVTPSLNVPPSKTAQREIPRTYLAVFEQVANQDEVPWTVLAGLAEELTKFGTTSPYDSTIRTHNYPTVSPPIGGGLGPSPTIGSVKYTAPEPGTGPMLLDSSASASLGPTNAQNVQDSVSLVGYTLEQDAQRLAGNEGLDYATELEEPIAQTSAFWTQAVAMLPIADTATTCAPPAGMTAVPAEIEAIWSCELEGKRIYLEAGPGVVLPAGQADAELVAEALQVAWSYSKWGTTSCSTLAGGVFPLPVNAGVPRCDAVANIVKAGELVVAAAEVPIDKRSAPEWSVLPGVLVDAKHATGQQIDSSSLTWSRSVPSSSACLAAIYQDLGLLPEPGPFSPDLIQTPHPTPAQKAAASARLDAAWSASALSSLRASSTCQERGSNGSLTTIPMSVWTATVATAADEALVTDEATAGEAASFSDLTGLLGFLDTTGKIRTAEPGATSLVPRLANPPVAATTGAITTPIPVQAGIPALAVSMASQYDGTPGATVISPASLAGGAASGIAGVPADWVGWAYQATAAECPGLSPLVLLGIGENESTWGESTLPGVSSGANYAGAEGPMQFQPATFAEYEIQPTMTDVYDPQDALFAAARYLCANGAATDWQPAVNQYCGGNPSDPSSTATLECDTYVARVQQEIAALQQDESVATLTSTVLPAGAVGAFVQAAESQIGLPYVWGGQSAGQGFDCSGLVDYALSTAGMDPAGVYLGSNGAHGATAQQLYDATAASTVTGAPAPGDLVFFGAGTSAVGHVGIYVGGGDMVDAPETGQQVQTQPYDWPDLVAITQP